MHVNDAPAPVQMLGKLLGIVPNCVQCIHWATGPGVFWCAHHRVDPDPHLLTRDQTCESWQPKAPPCASTK